MVESYYSAVGTHFLYKADYVSSLKGEIKDHHQDNKKRIFAEEIEKQMYCKNVHSLKK